MNTIAELINRYLEYDQANHSPTTAMGNGAYLKAFRRTHGKQLIAECTLLDVEAWANKRSHRWKSTWTRRDAVNRVRRAFAWAAQSGLIPRNPLQQAEPARPEREKKPEEAPKPLSLATRPKTLGEVLALYLSHTGKDYLPRVHVERKNLFALFNAEFGTMPLGEAKPFHLRLWIDSRESWKSEWTKNRVLGSFLAAFNWAWKLGIIDNQPFRGLSAAKGERGQPMETWEYQAMLRVSPPVFRRLLVFLRYTGCRPGEASKAEWGNLDTKRACIELLEHKTSKKTGKPRRIMLHPVALKLIAWIARHGPDDRLIFVNKVGRQWTNTAISWHLKDIRSRTKVRPETTLYGARHLFITEAVLKGIDIATIAALAGHTQISTTAYYMHVNGRTDHLQDAMGKIFAKPTTPTKGNAHG